MPAISEHVEWRKNWVADENRRILESVSLSEDYQIALWRLRCCAAEAIRRWPLGDAFQSYQLLTIVDGHDAAVDAGALLLSGMGPPSIAILRRAYEVSVLLTALWNDPAATRSELNRALANPKQHDNHAFAARLGMLGAVLPHVRRLRRHAGLVGSEALNEVERGLADFGHGGQVAIAYYAGDATLGESSRLEFARAFAEVLERITALCSAATSMIAQRLDFTLDDRQPAVFEFARVTEREDKAMDAFEDAFPTARHVIWAVCMGLRSLAEDFGEALGTRQYDDLRRHHLLMLDGVGTADLAFEMLHRGRLSAAATATRRLFELAHEAEGWAGRVAEMAAWTRPRGGTGGYKTPAATTMIDHLYSATVAALQRRTYSTLCSTAHGGLQAHAYLFDDGLQPIPAPRFDPEGHRWLLGTLTSALSQLVQSSLILAGDVDKEIERRHRSFDALLSGWVADMPILGLVGKD